MGGLVKCLVQSGINSGFKTKINVGISSLVSKQSPSLVNPNGKSMRHLSDFTNPNPKACLVDTLALVKNLECNGVPPNEAVAISSVLVRALSDSLEAISDKFVSKVEMGKNVKFQEAYLSTFKCGIQESQDRHFMKIEHENAKLRDFIDKVRIDLTTKIDHKVHRLEMKIEAQKDEVKAQLEAQKCEMKAQLEAAKFGVIKYFVGTFVSVSAVGVAVICLLS